MRDWAAAASRPDSAAGACRPDSAAASRPATAAHRPCRTGCCRDHAPVGGRHHRPDRIGRRREHPVRRDGRRPAFPVAAEQCRGPAAAGGRRRQQAAAAPGARPRGCGRPEPPARRGPRPPVRPSAPRRVPRRPPPRCHGRSPAWRPVRAWGRDGRPAAWAGPPDRPEARPAMWARRVCRQLGRRDDVAGSVARSSMSWCRSGRRPVRRRAPQHCRSTPRGRHEAAGPRGPRPCWMRI